MDTRKKHDDDDAAAALAYQPIKSGMRLRAWWRRASFRPNHETGWVSNISASTSSLGKTRKRSQRPASPLRREEHAGDVVIGASQDQNLQGEESVCAIIEAHSKSRARHWRNLGAPEKKGFVSPIREGAMHGESRQRKGTSNRDGITSIPFVLQLARRFCCPRQKAFFFVFAAGVGLGCPLVSIMLSCAWSPCWPIVLVSRSPVCL
jgi:hypothetical protein